ncbi:multidrug efflux SMR transporter Mmr [Nocardioides marinquilinus]|uniref:Multidrug efflux SMR transporter Mmr n=1 Tax=Nocardioides marinquilinus TaxID=1210400 RepID=A0ABP9Q2Z1_9ACTN
MAYLLLLGAIVLEVIGTSLLRSTEGFTRLWPTVACLLAYVAAFLLLSRIVQELPIGVTYALWSGIGTLLIVTVGVTLLGDPFTWRAGVGIGLIVAGVVVLNLGGAH